MKRRTSLVFLVILSTVLPAAADIDSIYRVAVGITCRDANGQMTYYGTGAIVHSSGYVLTSTTVVPEGVTDIKVHFEGYSFADARLVATNEKTELSIIKIKGDRTYPSLTIRRSTTLRVGETVFSVGNAFRCLDTSGRFCVSIGMLSGIYETTEQNSRQPVYTGRMLETTAALNPGMDGGPLLDSSGQLIGLLSLNFSKARWLGLVVPVNVLLPQMKAEIARDMKESGKETGGEVLAVTQKVGEAVFPKLHYIGASFQRALKKVEKGVVAMHVERTAEAPGMKPLDPPRGHPAGGDEAFKGYYKRPKAPVTGFLISEDGEILTSYFNVAGTLKSIEVELHDGWRFPAKVVGWSEAHDIALVKIDSAGLPALKLSKSPVELGSDVAVVGRSPDARGATLTRGVVSAIGRFNNSALQIDAPVNYGNAGGPLLSIGGEVAGIACHVNFYAPWGQNSGVAFATTADQIGKLLPDLRAGKKIKKPKVPFLGIARTQDAIEVEGALVDRVLDGHTAEKAGVKAGDIIFKMDDQEINNGDDLVEYLRSKKVGDTVKLSIRRGENVLQIEVKLGARPDG